MMRVVLLVLVVMLVGSSEVAAQDAAAEGGFDAVSTLWVLLAAFMVFLMQAGFGMVEQLKNATGIDIEKLAQGATRNSSADVPKELG